MNRRDFLKHSVAAVAGSSLLLAACRNKRSGISESEGNTAKGAMTKRRNPNTDDRISLLGYGMMRLPLVNSNPNEEDAIIDQQAVNELVDYALAHGVNYFDTSPVYCQGHSEEATGVALSRHPRNSYYIATKMSNFWPDSWVREESIGIFERSLQYLRTDYIDYLLLHAVGRGGEELSGMEVFRGRFMDNAMLDWLVEQKRIGRIRNLGFSYHGDIEVFDTLLRWHDEGKYHWDFVQIELNYLDWNYADEINELNTDASYLYAELEKRDIPAVIMEPLLGGRLAKLPPNVVNQMKQRDIHATPAQWAFRYAGTPKGVLTVLSGMTYLEHLRENCITYSPLRPITADENAMLMRIAKNLYEIQDIPCTGCNYCMPCPYGINIPAVFRYYNTCLQEDVFPSTDGGQSDREFRQARRRWLIGYDRSLPRMRQADHCIGCNRCVSQCPQHIDIPREMQRVDAYVEQLKQSM
jgi:hypothetical protein